MNLKDELEQALNDALRKHIEHMVEILMTATDDEEEAFSRFATGAKKAILRHRRLIKMLQDADI